MFKRLCTLGLHLRNYKKFHFEVDKPPCPFQDQQPGAYTQESIVLSFLRKVRLERTLFSDCPILLLVSACPTSHPITYLLPTFTFTT